MADETLTIPGFVNAHSHAFQRALRGHEQGPDFWAWRDRMIEHAERQSPTTVREEYEAAYREMRAAGYTAVGEFHYLGFDEALAAAEAAEAAGIGFVLLYAAYAKGGTEKFRQASVDDYLGAVEDLRGRGIPTGVAPHSVRACPPDWLEAIGAYAEAEEVVLHVHADEQPREIEECQAEHGVRPIELLAGTGCLSPRATIIHATHADARELDLVAEARARICVCPTTEANLGDGYVPVDAICERGIGLCIGSDSNVRVDPLEELRELEGIARRAKLARGVISTSSLLCFGADEGAAALGLNHWADVTVDLAHPTLARTTGDPLAALVMSGSAEALA